jgi:hypothetical protein
MIRLIDVCGSEHTVIAPEDSGSEDSGGFWDDFGHDIESWWDNGGAGGSDDDG